MEKITLELTVQEFDRIRAAVLYYLVASKSGNDPQEIASNQALHEMLVDCDPEYK